MGTFRAAAFSSSWPCLGCSLASYAIPDYNLAMTSRHRMPAAMSPPLRSARRFTPAQPEVRQFTLAVHQHQANAGHKQFEWTASASWDQAIRRRPQPLHQPPHHASKFGFNTNFPEAVNRIRRSPPIPARNTHRSCSHIQGARISN